MRSPTDFPEAYKVAAEAADEAAFLSLFENSLHVFDMWDDWSLSGMGSWRKMTQDWFGSLGQEKLKVTFSQAECSTEQTLAYLTAFVRFAAHDADGKELRSLNERVTAILRQQPDLCWKVAHLHMSAPIDSQTGKAIFERSPG